MTQESLERAKAIQYRINQLKDIKKSITPFMSERVELDISWKKGLMNYNAYEDSKRHYVLHSDSPLFLAIAGSLQDMINELQEQFNSLDSNLTTDYSSEASKDPIKKTSWWKKVWNRN